MISSVAAGLHHVDLSAGGEAPVRVVLRHQPQGGPDPVRQRQPGSYLHTSVPETELVPRVQSGELYWLDNILSSLVIAEIVLIPPNIAGMIGVLSGQVKTTRVEELLAILCGSQCWHDVQMSVTGPAVDPIVPVVLEVIL